MLLIQKGYKIFKHHLKKIIAEKEIEEKLKWVRFESERLIIKRQNDGRDFGENKGQVYFFCSY